MAEPDEVVGKRVGARLGVAAHVVHALPGHATVEDDQRDLVGAKQADRGPRTAGRDKEHAVDLALDEQPQVAGFLVIRFVRVAEHHGEPAFAGERPPPPVRSW